MHYNKELRVLPLVARCDCWYYADRSKSAQPYPRAEYPSNFKVSILSSKLDMSIQPQTPAAKMNCTPTICRKLFVGTLLGAFFSGLALAQGTAPANEEVVSLSPFVVDQSSETGWVATQSLAGSRLKTDIKDIAAPLEVMTKDFMDEFALNSMYDASIYSTNVEGKGDNYETPASYDNGTGFPNNARIRGLGEATLSRDFFGTKMPTDNYNLDRITIASGPNNLLFGTGSPAGVIDASLKRAQYRDSANIDIQFDSNNSRRGALDVNRVLVQDRLAARLSFLKDNKEYYHKPSGTDTTRYYGTLRWDPTRRTTISLHYEDAHVDNMTPSLLLPWDEISLWYDAPSSGFTGPGMNVSQPTYNNAAAGAPFVGSTIANTIWNRDNNNPVLYMGSAGGLEGRAYNVSNNVRIKNPTLSPNIDPLNSEADGYTLLDGTYYPVDKNLAGLQRSELVRSKTSNLFLTHQFNDNFSMEIAFQEEKYDGWVDGASSYTAMSQLRVDSNRFHTDGVTPNPNYGKRYTNSNFRSAHDYTRTSDWRVSLSYEKDFSKSGDGFFGRFMGVQRLAGLMSGNRYEYKWGFYDYFVPDVNGLFFDGLNLRAPTFNGFATHATRSMQFRYYMDGDDLSPQWPGLRSRGGPVTAYDSNGTAFTMDPKNSGYTDQYGRRLGANALIFLLKSKQETQQVAYQGFFWENRIAATLGWRKDTANSASPADSPFLADPRTGYRPIVDDIGFDAYDSANEQSGITRTLGLVVRPLQGLVQLPLGAELDLIYNKSDTFQPSVSSRNPLGDNVDGTAGEGEDIGVRLGLFDGRFNLRYTEFDTSGGPSRAANVPYNRWRAQAGNPLSRIMELATGDARAPLDPAYPEMFPVLGNADPYWVTSDKRSTGTEIGLDWNVTQNFQLRFNMNRQEVVETNVGTVWWDFLEEYLPQFQALTFPEGGIANPRDVDGDGTIGTWGWNTAWITDTDNETVAARFQRTAVDGSIGSEFVKSLEGKPNDFVRANRFNINAVYRFDQGRLNGFSIGGAFRYRAAPVIGYAKKTVGGQEVFDLDNRIYGDKETYLDLSFNYRGRTEFMFFKGYRIGLNIRNVLNEDDLFARLKTVAGAPIRVSRISEPRVFILSFSADL